MNCLWPSYRSAIPEGNIELIVMGKDPFPNDPVGVPFCKPSWDKQWAANSSGSVVLRALGIDRDVVELRFCRPIELFMRLASSHRIVFLNAAYAPLLNARGEPGALSLRRHKDMLEAGVQQNAVFVERAKTVLFCGEARKIHGAFQRVGAKQCAVHPDVRNRWNPSVKHQWAEVWAPGKLATRFNLSLAKLSSPVTTPGAASGAI